MNVFQHKLDEARQLLLAQDFAQALGRYDKLTRAFPGKAVVWFEYGNAASRLGQREAVTRAWGKALALEPGNAELILQIGPTISALTLLGVRLTCRGVSTVD